MKTIKTGMIPISGCRISDHRLMPPIEASIATMAKSLKEVGQLSPIGVASVTRGRYRVLWGATRYMAAKKLHWKHIRADIIVGNEDDYLLCEIVENLTRSSLARADRKKLKTEYKALLEKRLANVERAKGGRGKKGGQREEARQTGVSHTTVQRAKLAHTTENVPVSETATNGNGSAGAVVLHGRPRISKQLHMHWSSADEWQQLDRYNRERCGDGPLTECVRGLVRKALSAEGFWPPPLPPEQVELYKARV